jgi:fucose 4-O-acetylase-like acetyltransferase
MDDSEPSRNPYFDNLKGLLILLVIFGHAIQPLIFKFPVIRSFYTFIYLFHMPAFVFVSGYFTHKRSSLKRLFIYLLVFETAYRIYFFVIFDTNPLDNIAVPSWIIWYLVSLIIWRIMARFISDDRVFIFSIISFPIGLLIGLVDQVGEELSLSRTFVFAPFFFAGYSFSLHKPLSGEEFKRFLYPGLIIILCGLVISFTIFQSINTRWLRASFSYGSIGTHWPAGIIIRSIIYMISSLLCLAFFSLIPVKNTFFSHFGKHSLKYFVGHGFVVKLLVALGFYNLFH